MSRHFSSFMIASIIVLLILTSPLGFPTVETKSQNPAVDWWPMFRHDLNHTGYSTSTAPNTNETPWTFTTGGGVFSSPAVVGGLVYVGSDEIMFTV